MKLKVKLNKHFYIFFAFLIVLVLLYIQYNYSKINLINTYKNRELAHTLIIKDTFQNIFDKSDFIFKSELKANIQKLYKFYFLYKNIKNINLESISKILNRNEKKGYYEVFIINKTYKVIKASYKPDIGYNLGKYPVFKKILNKVFESKEKINISPIYIDPSSMNLKRYFLIRSPDKKYLLQIAYVVNIYHSLKKSYLKIKEKYRCLKKINLYFISKYLIYPIKFDTKLTKTPLNILIQETDAVYKRLMTISRTNSYKYLKNRENAKKVFKIFKTQGLNYKLNLNQNQFEVYVIIESLFKNFSNKLLINNIFMTYDLKKKLDYLKKIYILIFLFLLSIYLFIELIISYIRFKLKELVIHMNNNTVIKKKNSFIEEIDELVHTYNSYRNKLNQEIKRNKELLKENKRFVVDTIHQIKTPLSIIALNSDFIQMQTKDKEILESIEEIEAAISMLTHSYDDLSYFASKKVVNYNPAKVNFSLILKERIKFFSVLAKARNKRIIADIQKEIFFNINKVELERIIDNNISNAVDYSKKSEIYVELKKSDNFIVFKVVSFGDKIKDTKKIFEKNYREQEYKRGIGIGLNIVKTICEKYKIKYTAYYQNGQNIFEYKFVTIT